MPLFLPTLCTNRFSYEQCWSLIDYEVDSTCCDFDYISSIPYFVSVCSLEPQCSGRVHPAYFLASSNARFENNPNTTFQSITTDSWYESTANEGYNTCVACHALKQSCTLPIVILGILISLSWSLFAGLRSSERQRVDTQDIYNIYIAVGLLFGIVNTAVLSKCMSWLWRFRFGVARIVDAELTVSSRGVEAEVQLVNHV
ncbi:hypothetical protein TrLO_g3412 [Triparma laevis f. longispina]|uniref:Uncharacterized protein n=1 Tax=Triparma laevis f. longispina TaxID=1714387 RepID=A0A9W7CLZ8_9STRA|nr:hypothetical protein TrLO_g3412 [Triparma laevis f. longispina]